MSMIILGAGGLAREVYWHYNRFLGKDLPKVWFVDDVTDTRSISIAKGLELPVIKDWNFSSIDTKQFLVAVGSPKVKKILVKKALEKGLVPADPVVVGATLLGNVRLGKGVIITPGCVLTTDITIGDYAFLNLCSTVGHDAHIGAYSTINPGCNISGNVSMEEGVLLGTGTVVREKIKIARDVVTGAQACVVSDLSVAGATYIGTPAKELRS